MLTLWDFIFMKCIFGSEMLTFNLSVVCKNNKPTFYSAKWVAIRWIQNCKANHTFFFYKIEVFKGRFFLQRYNIDWDVQLSNITHESDMCLKETINTSSVSWIYADLSNISTACGLNTVHDLEWMCSQSANQLVMLEVIVSKLIPWVARGKSGLYCIPTQQWLFLLEARAD